MLIFCQAPKRQFYVRYRTVDTLPAGICFYSACTGHTWLVPPFRSVKSNRANPGNHGADDTGDRTGQKRLNFGGPGGYVQADQTGTEQGSVKMLHDSSPLLRLSAL